MPAHAFSQTGGSYSHHRVAKRAPTASRTTSSRCATRVPICSRPRGINSTSKPTTPTSAVGPAARCGAASTRFPTARLACSTTRRLAAELPEVLLSFWFDNVNAVQFQFRYYGIYGSKPQTRAARIWRNDNRPEPAAYHRNFATVPSLNPGGTRWYTFGGYYERRLTPLYQDYESGLPQFLQGWDSRAKVGVEFTYNDFRINDGTPLFSQRSPYEARIRFHEKGTADTGDRTRGAALAGV